MSDYLTLADMGAFLGVSYRTPYTWWKRTRTGETEYPMPGPVGQRICGQDIMGSDFTGDYGLLWEPAAIRAWFDDWKML